MHPVITFEFSVVKLLKVLHLLIISPLPKREIIQILMLCFGDDSNKFTTNPNMIRSVPTLRLLHAQEFFTVEYNAITITNKSVPFLHHAGKLRCCTPSNKFPEACLPTLYISLPSG